MEEEITSMSINKVWELWYLLVGRKIIKNKWVLNVKRIIGGSIEHFKAGLVAKTYTQWKLFNSDETFSPVVKLTSICLILVIISHMNFKLHQMNIKTAFVNGMLDENFSMEQLEGFASKGNNEKYVNSNDLFMDLHIHQDDDLLEIP